MQLTMGKALALIFTGCGIMLLCNFCIFFLVDNVRKNRNRNRGSIIRKRSTRRKSVSFTNPLVKQTVGQSNPSPREEIEMVDLGSSRAQSNPPPPAPTPLPPSRPTSTIPPQPMRPAPILNVAKPAKQAVLKPSRVAPAIPKQPTTNISFPTLPPPMPPLSMVRSMSTRQPHRYSCYKTFTILLF